VNKPEFNLLGSRIFQNVSIAAWDPGKYGQPLDEWMEKPDFDLFENFVKFRTKYPKSNFHPVDPRSIWQAWEVLQDMTDIQIRPNPPTSGFIGLGLLLPVCRYVDVVEYIPSTRLNGFCHYYDDEVTPECHMTS
jgi:beta-galactoside alpha-2,6-sialyltransferase (sialyltransferase 1)